MAGGRVRDRLVESPGSLGARSREKRWQLFAEIFPQVGGWRVVDLGGTPESWLTSPVRPKQVVVVNVLELADPREPWLRVERGDACALPERLLGEPFDLVFSNSLIEHVGGHARCEALARSVHRLAPRHWVQTPYRYFPVEPHFLFPGMQFLPLRARGAILRGWPLAQRRATRRDAERIALTTQLLSITEMRYYFPYSEIVRERFGPFRKSIVAVRRQP